ncbi:hypothetical protein, partial [Rossellomorea marisflavi]|uniref:hypothetical protein n=1 Tax=Rossellomorea marisflavi TaxID=189381 RepID=UPI00295EF3C6
WFLGPMTLPDFVYARSMRKRSSILQISLGLYTDKTSSSGGFWGLKRDIFTHYKFKNMIHSSLVDRAIRK